MTKPLTTVLKNSSYLFGARGMTFIVRGVYAIALARLLGPEQYGLYNYALGWYLAFMPFTSLGLGAVISRDVGQSKSRGKQTLSQSLALRSVLSLLFSIICAISGWFFHNDEITRQLLLILSFALLGRALAIYVENVFTAYSASKYVFKLEALFRPLEVFICISFIIAGEGLLSLAIINAAIWCSQGILGMILLQRRLFPIRPKWHNSGIKRLLRKGSLLGLSSFFVIWFLQGPLLLARYVGFDLLALGQLALLLQIFNIVCQFPQMLGEAALPILSQPSQQIDNNDQQAFEIGLKVCWVVGSVAGIFGWFIGPLLIEWVFGKNYQDVGQFLGIVLYLLVPWSWSNLLWYRMLARGLLRKTTLALFFGVATLTATFFPATTYLGFNGILLAMIIGVWFWMLSIYLFQKLPSMLLIKNVLLSFVTVEAILLIDEPILAFVTTMLITLLGFWFILVSKNERRQFNAIILAM